MPTVHAALVVLLLGSFFLVAPAHAATDDGFVRGYATAMLKQALGDAAPSIRVTDGVIQVTAGPGADRERIAAVLAGVPGAVRVEFVDAAAPAAQAPRPAPVPAPTVPAEPAQPVPVVFASEQIETGFLPGGLIFDPLLADPRWPHFSAALQRYIDDPDFGVIGAVSFGETIPLYRQSLLGGHWEVGLQAGVFAIFDMEADSHDLVNADYFGALTGAYSYGPFQAFARVFHQSSHLGDEFLLRTRTNRINLSYEAVDLKLSYHFFDRLLRVYAGGGYLFHTDPSSLKPWTTQAGFELKKRLPFMPNVTPVVAMDVQMQEENSWNANYSVRAGLQFDRARILGRRLLVMLEYFSGNSPNGQFFKNKIEYIGLGAHFYHGGAD